MGWFSLVIEALLALPAIIKALRDVIRELKNEGMTIDRSTVQDDIKEGVRRRAKPKR